jgi:transposase, IS5 family
MREKHTAERSLFDSFSDYQTGQELAAMSGLLDCLDGSVLSHVAADLGIDKVKRTGRPGLSAESSVRCAVLKQAFQLSYKSLAFLLEDSRSLRSFARLPFSQHPKISALHSAISRISAQAWEQINRALLACAKLDKVELGKVIRIDSTVCDTLIHAPTDSWLLNDSVRVLGRLLAQASKLPGGANGKWRDFKRVVKRRWLALKNSRGKEKNAPFYEDIIVAVKAMITSVDQVALRLDTSDETVIWCAQKDHFLPLIERVIDQTQRRVFNKEKVPASEKLVSLFEPHTDIIVKGGRDVQYGHKLNFTTGKSGLILDAVIEDGNPADSARFIPMIERNAEIYGGPARQSSADGGYASQNNLKQAKALGVKDVAFSKRRELKVEDMVKSKWVYKKLRNFRAGIEAGISCLKRAYGLGRCTWRGLDHFKSYVWASVVANNLAIFARIKLA